MMGSSGIVKFEKQRRLLHNNNNNIIIIIILYFRGEGTTCIHSVHSKMKEIGIKCITH